MLKKPVDTESLDNLREIALSAGCTHVQFQETLEKVGRDPFIVRTYLQRYAFGWEERIESRDS